MRLRQRARRTVRRRGPSGQIFHDTQPYRLLLLCQKVQVCVCPPCWWLWSVLEQGPAGFANLSGEDTRSTFHSRTFRGDVGEMIGLRVLSHEQRAENSGVSTLVNRWVAWTENYTQNNIKSHPRTIEIRGARTKRKFHGFYHHRPNATTFWHLTGYIWSSFWSNRMLVCFVCEWPECVRVSRYRPTIRCNTQQVRSSATLLGISDRNKSRRPRVEEEIALSRDARRETVRLPPTLEVKWFNRHLSRMSWGVAKCDSERRRSHPIESRPLNSFVIYTVFNMFQLCLEPCHNIKFCINSGDSIFKTVRQIQNVFGQRSMSALLVWLFCLIHWSSRSPSKTYFWASYKRTIPFSRLAARKTDKISWIQNCRTCHCVQTEIPEGKVDHDFTTRSGSKCWAKPKITFPSGIVLAVACSKNFEKRTQTKNIFPSGGHKSDIHERGNLLWLLSFFDHAQIRAVNILVKDDQFSFILKTNVLLSVEPARLLIFWSLRFHLFVRLETHFIKVLVRINVHLSQRNWTHSVKSFSWPRRNQLNAAQFLTNHETQNRQQNAHVIDHPTWSYVILIQGRSKAVETEAGLLT